MITKFQEKPEPGTEFSNLINAGCYLIEREVLKSLSSEKHSMERAVFPEIAKTGKMAGLEFKGYFVDAANEIIFSPVASVNLSKSNICPRPMGFMISSECDIYIFQKFIHTFSQAEWSDSISRLSSYAIED